MNQPRILILVFFFLSLMACDKIPVVQKSKLRQIDTVVNFSSVDLSPSFPECNSIIEKQEKSDCFRKTIHQKIGEKLTSFPMETIDDVNETIKVDLLVKSNGKIEFQKVMLSNDLKRNLPQLDSILERCIEDLPKILPATKRGIPVTTQYQLPIKISLKK